MFQRRAHSPTAVRPGKGQAETTTLTVRACGPFGPSSTSYSTVAPSARLLYPSPLIALWWTKTSLPPSSCVMNPYPLSLLNHFTVPVAISTPPSTASRTCSGRHKPKPGSPQRRPGARPVRALTHPWSQTTLAAAAPPLGAERRPRNGATERENSLISRRNGVFGTHTNTSPQRHAAVSFKQVRPRRPPRRDLHCFRTTVRLENEAFPGVNQSFETLHHGT